ncbi:asparaginase [Thiomicrorhabdus immobilis]|uniref:Asparaginase n=1 Tax=Thiomicrorhabdus immobilis TaxID=2791037 RepID=A0ABM7MDC4_9GAMM|nr:asparaginase domain-containing protein [Thiomicrorhabdus immobilis]BCN93390.1 asparaginase [Thiomicrorhabdus immobilis]
MNPASIQLLITGGTLDKDYQTTSGELIFKQTHLNELLREANTTLTIEPQVLMLKDSLEMTDNDREIIYLACLNTKNNQIVITHGTDTMRETAVYLSKHAGLTEKTIVLTGAMRPFKLGHSDASFNVAAALMAVQLAPNGVYITMNGQLFHADKVHKNRQLGQFEAV